LGLVAVPGVSAKVTNALRDTAVSVSRVTVPLCDTELLYGNTPRDGVGASVMQHLQYRFPWGKHWTFLVRGSRIPLGSCVSAKGKQDWNSSCIHICELCRVGVRDEYEFPICPLKRREGRRLGVFSQFAKGARDDGSEFSLSLYLRTENTCNTLALVNCVIQLSLIAKRDMQCDEPFLTNGGVLIRADTCLGSGRVPNQYSMGVSRDLSIDGAYGGSLGQLMNHSCEPSASAVVQVNGGLPVLCIVAGAAEGGFRAPLCSDDNYQLRGSAPVQDG
jgi:hypothetical protein